MVDEISPTEKEKLLSILKASEVSEKKDMNRIYFILGVVACGLACGLQMMDNYMGAELARRVDRLTLLTSGLLLLTLYQFHSTSKNMAKIQEQLSAVYDLLK